MCPFATRVGAPALADLVEHALPELVTGPGEREGGVGVQTLEILAPARPRDAERKLGPQAALLRVGAGETRNERRLRLGGAREALDAPGGLDPRHARHEPGASQIESRREGLAVLPERRLLRNRRKAVRTASCHPPERAGRTSQLPGDDSRVVHQIIVTAAPSSARRP